jgi:hypothetical protein
MKYKTEDNVVVQTGQLVYNYYDMVPCVIGMDCDHDGWFETFLLDGRPGHMMNGPRICSIGFAKRRGFRGAHDAEAEYAQGVEEGLYEFPSWMRERQNKIEAETRS